MSETAAQRPYIFCHMETSLDGKIMGRFWDVLDFEDDFFYEIAFGDERAWDHQGWISGRVTTDDNFTHYAEPELRDAFDPVPAGDFLPEDARGAEMYYISVDPHGRLGWSENIVRYRSTVARVIEVLCEDALEAYKDFLRRRNIPYIVCGKTGVDFALMLDKITAAFGFTCLMLGGGGVLNWSFIQQGLCDELSVVVDPSSDGSRTQPTLFMQADGLSTEDPMRFTLKSAEAVGAAGQQVWLRYDVR